MSLVMLGAVLSPVQQNWREEPRDSFPLSYYPMYAKELQPVEHIPSVVRLSRSGARYPVSHRDVGAGSRATVNANLRRLIAFREDKLQELCRRVAQRISRSGALQANTETVQIIIAEYDLSAYLSGKKAPLSEQVAASCAVDRQPES